MEKQIKSIFKNILKKNKPKDYNYYTSQGFLFEEGEPLPEENKYLITDDNYQGLYDKLEKLFADISKINESGETLKAFNAYSLILRECVILISKINEDIDKYDPCSPFSETYIDFDELIKILEETKLISIQKIVNITTPENKETNQIILKWLITEIIREEYQNHNQFFILSDLFNKLCDASESFNKISKEYVFSASIDEEAPIRYLKLNYLFVYRETAEAKRIISKYDLEYWLIKFFIEQLIKSGFIDDAIEYAEFYLNKSLIDSSTFFQLHKENSFGNKEIQKKLWEISDFINWSELLIIDKLTEQKYFDKAIDYVCHIFFKQGAFRPYFYLRQFLPSEKITELSDKVFSRADEIDIFAMRDLCECEDNWLPLIKSFKNSDRLAHILKIYNQNASNLVVNESSYFRVATSNKIKFKLNSYPDALSEMFGLVIQKYVDKGSGKDEMIHIRNGLKELLLIKNSQTKLLNLLTILKTKYGRRKLLQQELDAFIIENNIEINLSNL